MEGLRVPIKKEIATAGNRFKKLILPHLVLSAIGLLFLFPFIWLILSSLKTPQEIFQIPPTFWPQEPRWDNYIRTFEAMPFFRYTLNTIFLCTVNIVGQLIASPLTAYSLSRIEWKGRRFVFGIIIATMILPPQVTMIPVYIIFAQLGWVNTYIPLTIGAFFGSAFNIFLLRQFMMGIPKELSEAARIDGASEIRIYLQIIYPLLKPPLAAIAIFTFVGVWNDFMGPLIYLNDDRLWTITLGLQGFLSQHGAQWELLMAAGVIFTLPSVIIYFIGQKKFIEAGASLTSFK
ncbi:carbohydrate ABC transporter permease [Desmospora activa]|uniref:Carbohydrate ABC transporter membrane protein 2 (CUT1 family) n=1 Tax=Desmospora activa DSM 45169 TaxID=1121389 RepID=A0A2T4ZCX4_9BACL|nr:carbohydrate ABC transporter permease [Desmospora activa]PTM59733.1 carbohydrate ABC transporter membrane protein 2 (CUT1 family) [Desmospora activa DSM 45169]